MSYFNRALKTDKNGIPVPQIFNPAVNDFQVLEGSGNQMPMFDAGAHARLDAIEQKIDGIIDGTTPANIQLTGRRVARVFADGVSLSDVTERFFPGGTTYQNSALSNPDANFSDVGGKVSVYIRNTHDVAVLVRFYFHFRDDANWGLSKTYAPASVELAAGAMKLYTSTDIPALAEGFSRLIVSIQPKSTPTSGAIHIGVGGV